MKKENLSGTFSFYHGLDQQSMEQLKNVLKAKNTNLSEELRKFLKTLTKKNDIIN